MVRLKRRAMEVAGIAWPVVVIADGSEGSWVVSFANVGPQRVHLSRTVQLWGDAR